MGLWDDLPSDLLLQIAERIPLHIDLLSFGAVCRLWRSSLMENLHRLPHNKLPLSYCLPCQHPIPLLMQHYRAHDRGLEYFPVVNPDKRTHSKFLIPEFGNKWILGCSNGWLLSIKAREWQLLNPLTTAQLRLPSFSALELPNGNDACMFIEKATVSEEAYRRGRERDWMVMAIVSEFFVLSYCKRGDEKWTNIKGSPTNIIDVIPYRGQFYAICPRGVLVACDVADGMNKVTCIAGASDWAPLMFRCLVESSSGDLFQVVRVTDDNDVSVEEPLPTIEFRVFKLVLLAESKTSHDAVIRKQPDNSYRTVEGEEVVQHEVGFEWIELEHIGDQVIFIGYDGAVALSAHQCRCKGDCIYFTFGYFGMGIFDMEDRSIKPIEGMNLTMHATVEPEPFWFVPNPW